MVRVEICGVFIFKNHGVGKEQLAKMAVVRLSNPTCCTYDYVTVALTCSSVHACHHVPARPWATSVG